jgi:hypothetical protein
MATKNGAVYRNNTERVAVVQTSPRYSNKNSSANSAPATMPAMSVPSRLNNGIPRNCAYAATQSAASADRAAD